MEVVGGLSSLGGLYSMPLAGLPDARHPPGAYFCPWSGVLLGCSQPSIVCPQVTNAADQRVHPAYGTSAEKPSCACEVWIWLGEAVDTCLVSAKCSRSSAVYYQKTIDRTHYESMVEFVFELVERVSESLVGVCGLKCERHAFSWKFTGGQQFNMGKMSVSRSNRGFYTFGNPVSARYPNGSPQAWLAMTPVVVVPVRDSYLILTSEVGGVRINLETNPKWVEEGTVSSIPVVVIENSYSCAVGSGAIVSSLGNAVMLSSRAPTSMKLNNSNLRFLESPVDKKGQSLFYSTVTAKDVSDFNLVGDFKGKLVERSSRFDAIADVRSVITALLDVRVTVVRTTISPDYWPLVAARYQCLSRVIYVDVDTQQHFCCGIWYRPADYPDFGLILPEMSRRLALAEVLRVKTILGVEHESPDRWDLNAHPIWFVVQGVPIEHAEKIVYLYNAYADLVEEGKISKTFNITTDVYGFGFLDPDCVGIGAEAVRQGLVKPSTAADLWYLCLKHVGAKVLPQAIVVKRSVRAGSRNFTFQQLVVVHNGEVYGAYDDNSSITERNVPILEEGGCFSLASSKFLCVGKGGWVISPVCTGYDLVECEDVPAPQGNGMFVNLDKRFENTLSRFAYRLGLDGVQFPMVTYVEEGKEFISDTKLGLSNSFLWYYLKLGLSLCSQEYVFRTVWDLCRNANPKLCYVGTCLHFETDCTLFRAGHKCDAEECTCVQVTCGHCSESGVPWDHVMQFRESRGFWPDKYQVAFFRSCETLWATVIPLSEE